MSMIIVMVLQIIVAVILIGVILLQARGAGISATFGGSGELYRSRRSIERILMVATVILAIFFAALSIALFVL